MAPSNPHPALALPPRWVWVCYPPGAEYGALAGTHGVWNLGNYLVCLLGYSTPEAAWAAAWERYSEPKPLTHKQRVLDLGLLSYKRP